MADPVSAAILGGINLGTGLFGGLQQQHLQRWLQNSLMQIYNNSQNAIGQGWDYFRQTADPFRANMMNEQERMKQFLFGNEGGPGQMTGLGEDLSRFYGGMNPQFFQQSGLTPEMLENISMLQNTGRGLEDTRNLAQNVFAGGGWTPGYQTLQDFTGQMMGGQNPQMSSLSDFGTRMLGTGGQTALTGNLADRALDAFRMQGMTNNLQQARNVADALISSGGRTPQIDRLANAGYGALQSGGLTEQGAFGEATALDELINRGETPYSQFLGQRGAELAGQDSLIAPELAVSMARDRARSEMAGQAEAVRRQALARGGGPGSIQAAGVQNQALADFATQGQRAEADAVRNALLTQQQLQLQQAGQGAGMVGQGGQLATGRLNTAGNLLSQLEGVATNRFGIGGTMSGQAEQLATQKILSAMGLLPNIQEAATQNIGTIGNLALGGGNLENARMNLGLGGLDQYLRQQLGAGNLAQNAAQSQGQYALGAGNLAGNLAGTQGGLYNPALQGQLAGGRLGLDQMLGYTGTMGQGFGQRGNLVGQGLGLYGNTFNPLVSLAGHGIDWGRGGMAMQQGVFNPLVGQQSPIGQFISGAGQGLSSMIGGFLPRGSDPGFTVPTQNPGFPGGMRFPGAP